MKLSLILTPKTIFLAYTAYVALNDSIERADKLYASLRRTCYKLKTLPLRGNIPPELFEIGVIEFREIHLKPYRIIYSLEHTTVYVHCILDGRRRCTDNPPRTVITLRLHSLTSRSSPKGIPSGLTEGAVGDFATRCWTDLVHMTACPRNELPCGGCSPPSG